MAIKRALVVDDSKSARLALKKLLEQQHLSVSLAESGEDALAFLKRDMVDVIFMDHTMPGMDGLQAVAAIKANPRTATISVMMYTTKEGEVYVGQARALGAVGVLPKTVQSHEIFEMLKKLGLVKERRRSPRIATVETTDEANELSESARTPVSGDVDHELDQQAQGMSVQALVTRILEDQHTGLRSDILCSRTSFAKEVAVEVLREHDRRTVEQEQSEEEAAAALERAPREGRPNLLAIAAVTLLVAASFLGWQFKEQRDDLYVQVERLEQDQVRIQLEREEINDVTDRVAAMQENNEQLKKSAIQALVWAANQSNHHALGEPAFNESLALKLRTFIEQLEQMGFAGELRLTSHLGEFCMVPDAYGNLQLAAPDTPVSECGVLGHPLSTSSYVSDRLTVPFAQLLRAEANGGIQLELVALDLADSTTATSYPTLSAFASTWNDIAARNNRVEIEVVD